MWAHLRVKLENVSIAAIMSLVDHDVEVIVESLVRIAAQFRRYNAGRLRVVAMNAEVDGRRCIENANLRLFRGWLGFVGLALPKINNKLGGAAHLRQ